MVPPPSWCGSTPGNCIAMFPFRPPRALVSVGFTAEAAIRTRTSPGPGSGSGRSETTRVSRALPFFSYQAASISAPNATGSAPRSERRDQDGGRLEPVADGARDRHRSGRISVQAEGLRVDPHVRAVGGHHASFLGDPE